VRKEILYTMKSYQVLILAGSLVAGLLLAGCDNKSGGPTPAEDSSKRIMQGNNPADQPGQSRKPGAPGGAPGTGEGGAPAPNTGPGAAAAHRSGR